MDSLSPYLTGPLWGDPHPPKRGAGLSPVVGGSIMALSPVVGVLVFPQLLQHAGPELGPVLVGELPQPQGPLELGGVQPQEGVVRLLVSNRRRTLGGGIQREAN